MNNTSVRAAANKYNVNRTTLHRYVDKHLKSEGDCSYSPNYKNSLVFSIEQENELSKYCLTASQMLDGLTTKCIKKLAYDYAKANDITVPKAWENESSASVAWFRGFMKRHQELSLRTPEATSLSRATAFNKHTVETFFNNYKNVLKKHQFEPHAIYNCDETGITTVHKPCKVIAEKGKKQVGKLTSAERGSLVTVCGAVNAVGNAIPPFCIFPRCKFKDFMIAGAPAGTGGACNPSGWMNAEIFVQYLNHFVRHTRCSKDNKVLLLLDNHESHVSIDAINFARDNGIVMLTFPPHCSHRLQPLDLCIWTLEETFQSSS